MGDKRIIWQPKPIRQMRALEQYWYEEHGSSQIYGRFLDKLAEKLERISDYPEMGHPSGHKNVRYVRIDRYRSIFYRIHTDRVQILLLWDSRQKPIKNPYRR